MSDPATQYAEQAVAGDIVVSASVRDACRRHLNDLDRQTDSFQWHPEQVEAVRNFFEQHLIFTKGVWANQPFKLLPWQLFFLGSIYGWRRRTMGRWVRRFRRVFLMTGKGSGKSPLIAGVACMHLAAEREESPEVYVSARTFAQTGALFRYAAEMVRRSPSLQQKLTVLGGSDPNRIAQTGRAGFFIRVSSDTMGEGHSGPSPSMVIIDEYHEAASDAMLEFLSAGTKDRLQPLTFVLTNAGAGRQTACYEEDRRARAIARGEVAADDYFAFMCYVDDGQDPWKDEQCWEQANPSLPHTPTLDYLRGEVALAENNPSKRSLVDRLNWGRWTEAISPWLDVDKFNACVVADEDWNPPPDAPRFLALDVSRKADLSAGADTAVEGTGEDKIYWLDLTCWIPKDGLTKRATQDNVPYLKWVEDGFIEATPGPIVDFRFIVPWIGDRLASGHVVACAYDQWRIDELQRMLDEADIAWTGRPDRRRADRLFMVRHAQGFTGAPANAPPRDPNQPPPPPRLWMPRSVETYETAILTGRLRVRENPVLRWATFGCEVIADAQNNRALKKSTSESKIDPLVAAVMSIGAAEEFAQLVKGGSLSALYQQMRQQKISSVSHAG